MLIVRGQQHSVISRSMNQRCALVGKPFNMSVEKKIPKAKIKQLTDKARMYSVPNKLISKRISYDHKYLIQG